MERLRNLPQIKSLNEEERRIFYSLLSSSRVGDDLDLSKLDQLYYSDYEEIPVSIDVFIKDDRYLGKVFNSGQSIYPFWRRTFHDFFHNNPDNAFELLITGAIGTGKSTSASIIMTYLIYRTMCLKNPQKFYNLTGNAPIVFVCMNLTLDLAYNGLYAMIVESIKMSPWFCERVDIRGKYNFSIEFPKNISLICGSTVQHTIGKNVLGAALDEVNFSSAPKGSKRSVMDLYRNIRRRLESRFLRAGKIPGILMMISSKNNELDFLEQYIQSVKHLKTTWVIDRPVYDIKPPETYIGKRFKVAVGDKTKQSRVLSGCEEESVLIEQGYSIIEVPVEYKEAFRQDINEALKDIAGISTVSTSKLIPYAGKVESCINHRRKSPFITEILHMGLDSTDDIKDYLDDLSILRQDMNKPRFLHVDIGLRNDMLGISSIYAKSQTSVKKFTAEGNIEELLENVYALDFALGIKALSGSEIPLYKVREFIVWLADVLGWKIGCISYDGFQSADSLQLLKVAGFPTKLTSVDRTADPYLNLRSCILDSRFDMYSHGILLWELYDLEYDRVKNKVDHNPIDGHKDIADSVAGALWNCQEYYAIKHPSQPLQRQRVQRTMDNIRLLNEQKKKERMYEDSYSWLYQE